MFEYVSGRTASEVSEGSTEMREKMTSFARLHGIDTRLLFFGEKRNSSES